ncbi:hypothetical protein POVWA1_073870 [Plasmodium ovale wallikeri]|uniref:STP1 protein n=1 Tax=Plasmodium ovale wallikeri TaxID=864142 RepID=A0A1A9AIU9_PLAOA|nr:hypothetical protein POVWA1_073870 [Plasmodium ovale wallikeri]
MARRITLNKHATKILRCSYRIFVILYNPYRTILRGSFKKIRKFRHKVNQIGQKNYEEEDKNKSKISKNFVTKEWNIIRSALEVTFKSQKVNRLCYLDNDKKINHKKYILDLHELFRNFCIQKKERLQNTSEVDFEKCSEYMSWIDEKKKEIQGRDPNYDYIKQYEEYFYIHTNCNYPWLLKGTPDIICRMKTRTSAGEKDNKPKTLNSPSQSAPDVTTVSNSKEKKDIPAVAESVPKGEQDPAKAKPPDTADEKEPKKFSPTLDGNIAGIKNDLFHRLYIHRKLHQPFHIENSMFQNLNL